MKKNIAYPIVHNTCTRKPFVIYLASCLAVLPVAFQSALASAQAQLETHSQDDKAQKKELEEKPQKNLGIVYETQTTILDLGKENKELKDEISSLLLSVSESHRLEDKPPASQLILKRRAKNDLQQLNRSLRSRGYYGAELDYKIEENKADNNYRLSFLVSLGEAYQIAKVALNLIDEHPQKPIQLPENKTIGLAQDKIADARDILKAQEKLLLSLHEQAYPYAQIAKKRFVVNHQEKTMNIHWAIQLGPRVLIQKAKFEGVEAIDLEFLESLISWKDKDAYHPDSLEETAQQLIETDLFSTVRLELPAQHEPEKVKRFLASFKQPVYQTDVKVILKERKHRTIKSRLAFSTDKGIDLSVNWTHRNYFGAGEKLSVSAAWTGLGPLLEASFRKPNFYHPKQALLADMSLKDEETDAYDSRSFNLSSGLERELKPGMDISLGLGFRHSQITEKNVNPESGLVSDSSQNYSLVYVPGRFNWDFSNDLFEPDEGGRLLVQGAPYVDTQSSLTFGKLLLRYTHYYRLIEKPDIVLAGRLVLGGISGAESHKIPADLRFFAGGGGSVRGYGYQLASPLDANGDPRGGNALFEFSFEARMGFGNNIGAVFFVDGGAAYTDTWFDSSNELRFGTGLGLRYASPIGPLRADVAIPVSPRDDIDDKFQVYLSIGHAF